MNQIPDVVGKTLDELSKRFGATGVHLWSVYVQYTFAVALTDSIIAAIFGAVFGFLTVYQIKKFTALPDKDIDTIAPALTIGIFTCSLITIISMITLSGTLPGVFSPEGAALTQMLSK